MSLHSPASRGALAIVFSSCLWGTTGTAARFAPEVSPLAIGAFAMGVGGILLVLTACRALRGDRAALIDRWRTVLLGGIAVAVYPLAFYSAMHLAGVAIGTVVSIASAPLFTALLERLLNHRSISTRWSISFVLGALGVGLLALGETSDLSGSVPAQAHYAGIALGMVAGLSYALYSWAGKQLIDQGIRGSSAMASMFGLAALLLLPSLLLTGDMLLASTRNAAVAIYMAVLPMFVGYLCFGYGLSHLAASTATLITLLEPVVAMLLAVVILQERFGLPGWLGMGFILACVALQAAPLPRPHHRRQKQIQCSDHLSVN